VDDILRPELRVAQGGSMSCDQEILLEGYFPFPVEYHGGLTLSGDEK
jgi:hypothetical protein